MSYNSSQVHSFFLQHEDLYTWQSLQKWCGDRPHYPVLAVAAYILVISRGEEFMSNRKAVNVKPILFAWNTGLALFSLFASFRAISYLLHVINDDFDMDRLICDNEADNVSGYWVYLFTMSKFVEMGDTVFLLIRKKPVMFLHWYHHLTVLLFTWIATVANAPVGKFFAVMNVIVHSFMYTYYAIQTLGYRLPRIVSISVTCMQISQMLFGIAILLMSYSMSYDSNCRSPAIILITGAVIYGSYFTLFVEFFVKSYFRGGRKSKTA